MPDEILRDILDTAKSTNSKCDHIEDQLTRIQARIETHDEQLEYLNKVVWRGNGTPALTKQMSEYTEQIASLRNDVASLESRLESKKEMILVLVITLVGSFVGGIMGGGK